jgi:chromosome segregation ATPase
MSSGLLGLFGLARATHLRAATERVNTLKEQAADAKQRLEAARQDATHWKERAAEANGRIAAATQDVERWKSKDSGHLEELATVQDKLARLKQAEQVIELTRGHLLTMETKLDVLEGAITVLDQRTRDSVERPARERTATSSAATKPS